jgi:antitoxin ParD1/3/4
MNTMNISIPESLQVFVDLQVGQRGFETSSEYVRELIRMDQDRQNLRSSLLRGALSADAGAADQSYFEGLRESVRSRNNA